MVRLLQSVAVSSNISTGTVQVLFGNVAVLGLNNGGVGRVVGRVVRVVRVVRVNLRTRLPPMAKSHKAKQLQSWFGGKEEERGTERSPLRNCCVVFTLACAVRVQVIL